MDLQHLRASDGTGEAVLAHVQATRTIGSTVLDLDNVDNWNTNAIVVTGTPAANGFVSPTGMTIMYGHLNAGDFIIDGYAPGYSDAGNTTAEVAIIKMTTSWADTLVDILKIAHEDTGHLKAGAADRALNAPQGFLINGKIDRTVSSNNITIAIKTLAGATPSASDPVYVRIGDTIRSITAALSVTKNAGTNWLALGSTEHATQDVDVFVYLGYNATDGVTIGFSRIPYARIYSDFSATTTNEKYAAISTITNAAASDVYEVVGRVNVTLSATASFNWSVPATSIVINRPVFQTRWLSYTPVLTNFTGTINVAKYQLSVQKCNMYLKITQGASVTGNHTFTLPISTHADYAIYAPIHSTLNGYIQDLGTAQYPAQTQLTAANTLTLLCTSAAGTYTSSTATSATVPMIWVSGQDSFLLEGNYPPV